MNRVPSWAGRVALSLGAALDPGAATAAFLRALVARGPVDAAWIWRYDGGHEPVALLAARPERPVERMPEVALLEGEDPQVTPPDADFKALAAVTGRHDGCFVRFALPRLGALLVHSEGAVEPRDLAGLRLLAARLRVLYLTSRAYRDVEGVPADPAVDFNESLEQSLLELSSSQERLERSVREREAQYRGLFEHAPVSLWELDLTGPGERLAALVAAEVTDLRAHLQRNPQALRRMLASVRVLAVNNATLALFGARGPAELQPPALFRVFGLRSADVFIDVFAGMHAGQSVFEHELSARALDGRPVEVLLRLVGPVGGGAGWRPVLVSMTDITALKGAERALAGAARSLERSNADLQQFAYAASHDLQEPLRVVAGFAELLAERYGGRLDEDADRFLAFIVDAVRRMQTLIRDLLQYARVETLGGSPRETSAEEALTEAMTVLSTRLQETAGRVERSPLPRVQADPAQLHQLFQNLIGNALKFCRGRAPVVEITARRARDRQFWKFVVRDNGIGIAPEHLGRVFDVFRRLNPQGEFPGTGIGLAVCKRIVDRHGGRIWVESTPGEGSTFVFTLPAVEAEDG